MNWVNLHSSKIQSIQKKQYQVKTDYLVDCTEIRIFPKNSKSLPLCFFIGGVYELDIQFGPDGEDYHIIYRDYDFNIDTSTLDAILTSYLNGDYFIKDYKFYIKNLNNELIEGEGFITSQKRLDFPPL
ncbi:hypothetical protein [Legionella sp. PC997]|uniref:hypothetical protein n=1 Tax=Legionella sp. PC997 TaxID=2755562 RepID=UPI0015FCC06E|nr:hypothetical protein [Legionella sp. PC997]QMT60529.1 hypothetical protein HBNCFIEN_01902 [Legionella sp. PC997]